MWLTLSVYNYFNGGGLLSDHWLWIWIYAVSWTTLRDYSLILFNNDYGVNADIDLERMQTSNWHFIFNIVLNKAKVSEPFLTFNNFIRLFFSNFILFVDRDEDDYVHDGHDERARPT